MERAIISYDGSTIACGSSSAVQLNNLFVFDFSSNQTLWTFNTTDQVVELDFTRDGSHLVAGSYNSHFYVFSRTSNQSLLDYELPGYVFGVGTTLNGTQFVCGAANKAVYFELTQPQVTLASTSRTFYNSRETIIVNAQVARGTLPIFGAYVNYTNNNDQCHVVEMDNLTILSDSLVGFSVSIGPFDEGNVAYHVWSNDTFALDAMSAIQTFNIDGTPPESHLVYQTPTSPNSTQSVDVIANITDAMSGAGRVLLNYSINNGTTWTTVEMSVDTHGIYTGTIPSQENGTSVLYHLIAFDMVNNCIIVDDDGGNFEYVVLDPATTSTATTTTPATTTTTTNNTAQSPLESPLLLPMILGLAIGLSIVTVLVVRHLLLSRFVTKADSPEVDAPATEALQ